MNKFVILSALFALTAAQFPDVPGIIGVPGPRWTGPIANHVNGQLVPDTPEVAAAKAQHAQAHLNILAVLPELPPEQRYQKSGIPIVPNQQQPQYINHIEPTSAPIHTSPQFRQFAEEIPRSPIGEVPEVHAARQAHLAAFKSVQATLPKLRQEPVNPNPTFPVVPQQPYIPQYNQFNQNGVVDTPEVLAARAEHARAVAALG